MASRTAKHTLILQGSSEIKARTYHISRGRKNTEDTRDSGDTHPPARHGRDGGRDTSSWPRRCRRGCRPSSRDIRRRRSCPQRTATAPTTPTGYQHDTPNPFRPTKHAATGKWHDPIYSLRRQAELVKLAREHGVEELLPHTPKGTEAHLRKRVALGLARQGHRRRPARQGPHT